MYHLTMSPGPDIFVTILILAGLIVGWKVIEKSPLRQYGKAAGGFLVITGVVAFVIGLLALLF